MCLQCQWFVMLFCVCVCVCVSVCVCVCVCARVVTPSVFFQITADSHLLHLFITGLNAVTLSSCAVPQASLRSDGCVSALPPENPAHPNKGKKGEKKAYLRKKKPPQMQVGRKCLVVTSKTKKSFVYPMLVCLNVTEVSEI